MKLPFKIDSAFNKLVISRHSLSIEETGRRKLFTIFLLLIAFPLVVFGIGHLKKGVYIFGVSDEILALIFIMLIFILRSLKDGIYIYRIAAVLLEVTLFYWIKTGAINGYASIWAMIIPPFTFFLMGKKEGLFWTSICAVYTVLLFINPFNFLKAFSYPPDYISRYLFVFFVIWIFIYNYESVREKYKSAMESEQAKLLVEKEKLAEAKDDTDRANNLLRDEMKVREQTEIELRRHRDHLEEIVAERTLEIKKNSEELKASEKRYRLIADNIDDLIWATDMNMNFTFVSPSVYRIYGYTVEEAMNLSQGRWNTPDSYKKIIETYRKKIDLEKTGFKNPDKYTTLQLEQIKKDGSVFPVELKASFMRDEKGNAVGIAGITRDISDRMELTQERDKIKEQLAQSQKMEALGTLVGGLAHDFNNFLGGIIGSFDLLSMILKKENLKKKDSVEKYLHTGMESSKRSAGLINQLLILSKKHEIKLSPLDIKSSLNHIYELCRNSFPKSIELNFRIDEAPLIIMGDMVQIEQVLLNLCINASHAMTIMRPPGAKHGGILTVTAEKVESGFLINENYPETGGIVNHWISIKVSDTGIGIDNETKHRIFEPFFSTKNTNESSGLGLAISYNIIQKHGGVVNVYSEPGKGSCFSIYFPVHEDKDKSGNDDIEQKIISGSGTVLVIDDEPAILNIAEGFLEQCGYNVITAEGADNGIETYRKEHSRISAVLIDLSMPGKSGLETFQELKEIDPNVKVILSSGMLDNETKDLSLKIGIKETVNKPYMAGELSMKIKTVINGR